MDGVHTPPQPPVQPNAAREAPSIRAPVNIANTIVLADIPFLLGHQLPSLAPEPLRLSNLCGPTIFNNAISRNPQETLDAVHRVMTTVDITKFQEVPVIPSISYASGLLPSSSSPYPPRYPIPMAIPSASSLPPVADTFFARLQQKWNETGPSLPGSDPRQAAKKIAEQVSALESSPNPNFPSLSSQIQAIQANQTNMLHLDKFLSGHVIASFAAPQSSTAMGPPPPKPPAQTPSKLQQAAAAATPQTPKTPKTPKAPKTPTVASASASSSAAGVSSPMSLTPIHVSTPNSFVAISPKPPAIIAIEEDEEDEEKEEEEEEYSEKKKKGSKKASPKSSPKVSKSPAAASASKPKQPKRRSLAMNISSASSSSASSSSSVPSFKLDDLESVMSDIFESCDSMMESSSESRSIPSKLLDSLRMQISRCRADDVPNNRLADLDPSNVVRLMKILEIHLTEHASSDDVEEMTESLVVAGIALSIMSAENISKQAMLEEVLDSLALRMHSLCRRTLLHVYDSSSASIALKKEDLMMLEDAPATNVDDDDDIGPPAKKSTKKATTAKKQQQTKMKKELEEAEKERKEARLKYKPVVDRLCNVLQELHRFAHRESITEKQSHSFFQSCLHLFFIPDAPLHLLMAATPVLSTIFGKHADLRASFLSEIVSLLPKLPLKNMRIQKLNGSSNIHPFTGLIVHLLNSCAAKPLFSESPLIAGPLEHAVSDAELLGTGRQALECAMRLADSMIDRCCGSVSSESAHSRAILETLVDDLLAMHDQPLYPGADLLLFAYCRCFLNIFQGEQLQSSSSSSSSSAPSPAASSADKGRKKYEENVKNYALDNVARIGLATKKVYNKMKPIIAPVELSTPRHNKHKQEESAAAAAAATASDAEMTEDEDKKTSSAMSTPMSTPGSSKKVYCVCRGYDDGTVMICCDRCEEWFHSRCVGLPVDFVAKTWICPLCDPVPSILSFAPQYSEAPEKDALFKARGDEAEAAAAAVEEEEEEEDKKGKKKKASKQKQSSKSKKMKKMKKGGSAEAQENSDSEDQSEQEKEEEKKKKPGEEPPAKKVERAQDPTVKKWLMEMESAYRLLFDYLSYTSRTGDQSSSTEDTSLEARQLLSSLWLRDVGDMLGDYSLIGEERRQFVTHLANSSPHAASSYLQRRVKTSMKEEEEAAADGEEKKVSAAIAAASSMDTAHQQYPEPPSVALAHVAARMILTRRRMSLTSPEEWNHSIVGILCSALQDPVIGVRQRAIKALSSILPAAPEVIKQVDVWSVLKERGMDQSPSVREAFLDLCGKAIKVDASYRNLFLSLLMQRANDKAVSVRKRVISILGEMCQMSSSSSSHHGSNNDDEFVPHALRILVERLSDEEESVKKATLNTLQTIWFSLSSSEDVSADESDSAAAHVHAHAHPSPVKGRSAASSRISSTLSTVKRVQSASASARQIADVIGHSRASINLLHPLFKLRQHWIVEMITRLMKKIGSNMHSTCKEIVDALMLHIVNLSSSSSSSSASSSLSSSSSSLPLPLSASPMSASLGSSSPPSSASTAPSQQQQQQQQLRGQDRLDTCLTTLCLFAVADISLVAPHFNVIRSYLSTSEQQQKTNPQHPTVLIAAGFLMDKLIAISERQDDAVVQDLRQKFLEIIVSPANVLVWQSTVRALSSLAKRYPDIVMPDLLTFVDSRFRDLYAAKPPLAADAAAKINFPLLRKPLVILSLFVRYLDFDQPEFRHFFTPEMLIHAKPFTSTIQNVFALYHDYCTLSMDLTLRTLAVSGLGSLLIRNPKIFEKGAQLIAALLNPVNPETKQPIPVKEASDMKRNLLKSFTEFLLEEENKIEEARAKGGLESGASLESSMLHTSMTGGLVQRYKEKLFELAHDKSDLVRNSAIEFMETVVRQSHIPPTVLAEDIIAVCCDPLEVNRRRAIQVFTELDRRHHNVIMPNCIAKGIQSSYILQRELKPSAEITGKQKVGGQDQSDESCLLSLYRTVKERKNKHQLYLTTIRQAACVERSIGGDRDPKTRRNQVLKKDPSYPTFLCNALAALPFTLQEDPLQSIYTINAVVNEFGGPLREELKRVVKPEKFAGKSSESDISSGSSVMEPSSRPSEDPWWQAICICFIFILKKGLKTYYNLSGEKILSYRPDMQEKVPRSVGGAANKPLLQLDFREPTAMAMAYLAHNPASSVSSASSSSSSSPPPAADVEKNAQLRMHIYNLFKKMIKEDAVDFVLFADESKQEELMAGMSSSSSAAAGSRKRSRKAAAAAVQQSEDEEGGAESSTKRKGRGKAAGAGASKRGRGGAAGAARGGRGGKTPKKRAKKESDDEEEDEMKDESSSSSEESNDSSSDNADE